jgi:hypothetical protein
VNVNDRRTRSVRVVAIENADNWVIIDIAARHHRCLKYTKSLR